MSTAIASGSAAGFSQEVFEQFLSSRNEPAWVSELRREAFAKYSEFLEQPLDPEEWKRIDLRALKPSQFHLVTTQAAAEANAASGLEANSDPAIGTLLADRAEFAGRVIHVDGQSVISELSEELAARGVVFGSLTQLIQTHGELLKPYLMQKAVKHDQDRMSAWHAAFWTGGTVLYVPRNVRVEAPLYGLVALAKDKAADFSHTLVILEDGAEATLLEETTSLHATHAGLHVGGVELLLGQEARLRYVQLQNWNHRTWHLATQAGHVEKDGFLQWTVGGLGSRLAHTHQDVSLDGRGAVAQVNGVTFAINRQVISYYTQQTHRAPDTRSDLLYKDVLRDESRVIWRGMIDVEKGAPRTDGYQRNDSLLLSTTARADAIPGLEIETDDVRCTHGATVGEVDQDQILYCMCRGLSRHEAMHMIVEGFFQQVYDRIPVPAVQETLSQAVERKLGLGRDT
ncbi:FeS cluster assembly protein SufB [Planctopirus ephydatiae]|uniref:FeS cluster assembly protein SufB n=1 Tax=Planctopirus ephydatiae TaxID=2528019 RepID=A0A518GRM2_9PLAN|nr:Fe-S cluster assembly protein SufD [Planctopirus ephydatiae]QDV31229.1 FeS cluster assembly protein SufB [Planctopirus ephydatiae]